MIDINIPGDLDASDATQEHIMALHPWKEALQNLWMDDNMRVEDGDNARSTEYKIAIRVDQTAGGREGTDLAVTRA